MARRTSSRDRTSPRSVAPAGASAASAAAPLVASTAGCAASPWRCSIRVLTDWWACASVLRSSVKSGPDEGRRSDHPRARAAASWEHRASVAVAWARASGRHLLERRLEAPAEGPVLRSGLARRPQGSDAARRRRAPASSRSRSAFDGDEGRRADRLEDVSMGQRRHRDCTRNGGVVVVFGVEHGVQRGPLLFDAGGGRAVNPPAEPLETPRSR